jgi:hypothetical protein
MPPVSAVSFNRILGGKRPFLGNRLRHGQLRPQHRLYFFPDPHGHGSLRPTFPKFGASSLNWPPTCWPIRQALRVSM